MQELTTYLEDYLASMFIFAYIIFFLLYKNNIFFKEQ